MDGTRSPRSENAPSNIPTSARWYRQGEFLPWAIYEDPAYQKLTTSERLVYKALCGRSFIRRNSPARRYIAITYWELADSAGVSWSTVKRAIKKILRSRLATRWHRGTPETGRSRYELPASRGMIQAWRVKFSPRGRSSGERR